MTDAAFREGVRAILAELRLMRATLERFLPDEDTPPQTAEDMPICTHPDDSRVDFGFTDGHPDWMCQLCGYRSLAEVNA